MWTVEGERRSYKSTSVEGKREAQSSWQLLASGNITLTVKQRGLKEGWREGGGVRVRLCSVNEFFRRTEAEMEGKKKEKQSSKPRWERGVP